MGLVEIDINDSLHYVMERIDRDDYVYISSEGVADINGVEKRYFVTIELIDAKPNEA